jgi:hypothetical protein
MPCKPLSNGRQDQPHTNGQPSRRQRVLAALGVAVVAAGWTYVSLRLRGDWVWAADFTYPWLAARAVWKGVDAYAFVARSHPPFGPWLLYPLPAALVTLPIAWLPMRAAASVGVGASCGFLAFSITRTAFWPLLMFLSAPAVRLADSVQIWPPMFTAAAFWAPGLGLLAAKPNFALPIIAFQTKLRSVVIGAVAGITLVGLSFMVDPHWLARWIAIVRDSPPSAQFRPPMLRAAGSFLVLSALRWRRPEGRLLFCMALVPQTAYFYDQLPLLLVPGTRRQMVVYAFVSQIAALLAPVSTDARPVYVIAGLYLPALLMLLLRPNDGPAPAWLERLASRTPTWLRGRATPANASM